MTRDNTIADPTRAGSPLSNNFNTVYNLEQPSTFWRLATQSTFFSVATLCRSFLYGLNKTETRGLPQFLELLKSRADPSSRQRGLITVSNHVSVMDDPLIWGVLPLSFQLTHGRFNNRFGFGSHDICFQGTLLSHFFTLGQVLPTHRLAHSPFGGPTQPAMLEAIRLLSPIRTDALTMHPHTRQIPTLAPGTSSSTDVSLTTPPTLSWPSHPVDPFSSPSTSPYFFSSPLDTRAYHAPSRFSTNSFSWIHIFPEGMIHQSDTYDMRYFKWGVARLILEPPVCPDVVPMWIEGTDQIMHESRQWPRFIPRAGRSVSVTFGEVVREERFGDLRSRWRDMREKWRQEQRWHGKQLGGASAEGEDDDEAMLGILPFERPQDVLEVRELWIETTNRVREELLKLRRGRGWPDEDPKGSVAETWRREGPERKGRMQDGTWVGDT